MKRFIRYLYEYKQGKRLRNVGFVKVEQEEEECAVHIHGKGLHMNGERKLELYLFYEEGDTCVGIWQGTVDNVNPAINYRLHYTKEDTGTSENYLRINGIILESETGRRYAAVWDDMPVDVDQMHIWKQKTETMEDRMVCEVVQRTGEKIPSEKEQGTESTGMLPENGLARQEAERRLGKEQAGQEAESKSGETVQTEEEQTNQERGDLAVEIPQPEKVLQTAEMPQSLEVPEKPMISKGIRCLKIQRTDLAKLPRCEWKWANNQFLLHGYYNYHHLMLLEDEKGMLRLGIPGIYHPQEAKAAAALGFGEFIPTQDVHTELTEEERNDQEQFGYWCRYVKGQMPGGRSEIG